MRTNGETVGHIFRKGGHRFTMSMGVPATVFSARTGPAEGAGADRAPCEGGSLDEGETRNSSLST